MNLLLQMTKLPLSQSIITAQLYLMQIRMVLRIQLAEKIIKPEEILTEEAAARLLTEGYLKPLEEQYPKSVIKLVLNQADCDIVKEKGEQVAKETGYPAWVASLRQGCKE